MHGIDGTVSESPQMTYFSTYDWTSSQQRHSMCFYVSCSPDIQRIVLAVIKLKHKAIRIYNDFLLIFNSAVLTVYVIYSLYIWMIYLLLLVHFTTCIYCKILADFIPRTFTFVYVFKYNKGSDDCRLSVQSSLLFFAVFYWFTKFRC